MIERNRAPFKDVSMDDCSEVSADPSVGALLATVASGEFGARAALGFSVAGEASWVSFAFDCSASSFRRLFIFFRCALLNAVSCGGGGGGAFDVAAANGSVARRPFLLTDDPLVSSSSSSSSLPSCSGVRFPGFFLSVSCARNRWSAALSCGTDFDSAPTPSRAGRGALGADTGTDEPPLGRCDRI